MGLESIISIIPTIGNIVGGLLESIFTKESDGPLRKYSIRLGNSLEDEIDFKVENGKIVLANRTPYTLSLSFPAQNGNEGETIYVNSCKECNMTERFELCAANDIDNFEITVADPQALNRLFSDSTNALTVTASGMVTIGSENPCFIGAYTRVKVTTKDITICEIDASGNAQLVALYIQSAGGSEVYKNHDVPMDKNNEVTLSLPLTLVANDLVHVSVTVAYSPENYAELMSKNDQKYGIWKMTTEQIHALENAIYVNRKA